MGLTRCYKTEVFYIYYLVGLAIFMSYFLAFVIILLLSDFIVWWHVSGASRPLSFVNKLMDNELMNLCLGSVWYWWVLVKKTSGEDSYSEESIFYLSLWKKANSISNSLNLDPRKRIVRCFVWSVTCGRDLALTKADKTRFEAFEVSIWRRIYNVDQLERQ